MFDSLGRTSSHLTHTCTLNTLKSIIKRTLISLHYIFGDLVYTKIKPKG